MNERSFIRMSHIQQPENIARVTKKCKTNDLERRPKLNLAEEKKEKNDVYVDPRLSNALLCWLCVYRAFRAMTKNVRV